MYEIYLGIKRKWSISRISREIEVSASTVLREIRRNSNANGYNPLEINLKNVVSKNVTVKNASLPISQATQYRCSEWLKAEC